jgi:hypothetical protein
MPTTDGELRIGERFCGPPGFANGGIACGSLAAVIEGAAEVTLRRPVPLARRLAARRNGDGAWLVEDGDALVAEVRPAATDVEFGLSGAVTLGEARAAAGRARYYDDPMFPGCFVCGPTRRPGDGLRIFPGPVNGDGVMAAPWTPDSSVTDAENRVRPEVVWAALDCPSGLAAVEAFDLPPDTAVLLGRMTARLNAPPRAGDQCRLVAWADGRDGRKLYARSALLGPGDEMFAAARAVWLTVPRNVPQPAAGGAS